MQKSKPVCLVIGAGTGIGGHVGQRFAREGYHSVLIRRSNQKGLDQLVTNIKKKGGEATGFILDVTKPDTLEQYLFEIDTEIGAIDTLIFNLGAQTGFKSLAKTTEKVFELGWRLATLSLFRVASAVIPLMEKRKKGVFLVTSSTAAFRGNAGQHAHASAMAGRRMLCQTLNAEFASKGIHIAHILIDGLVDAPDTLGKMLGEKRFNELRKNRGSDRDGLVLPEKIAETYLHLAQQHRSAWTHEIDLRSFSDLAWWNHQTTTF